MLIGHSIPMQRKNIVKDGLKIWLEGEDFTNSPLTGLLRDRSGNANNATPSGMAYTTSSGSDNDGGIVLDGVDDKLDIIDYCPFNTDTEHTLEVTFKLSLYTSGSILVSFGGTGARYFVGFGAGGAGLWYIGNTSLSSSTVALNTKTKFSFVRSGTTYKVYVNGIKSLDLTSSLGGAISNTGTPFRVGAQWGTNSGYMQGKIYNVMLYDRALTDAQILQNYNATK